jgi:hypothetical protein
VIFYKWIIVTTWCHQLINIYIIIINVFYFNCAFADPICVNLKTQKGSHNALLKELGGGLVSQFQIIAQGISPFWGFRMLFCFLSRPGTVWPRWSNTLPLLLWRKLLIISCCWKCTCSVVSMPYAPVARCIIWSTLPQSSAVLLLLFSALCAPGCLHEVPYS